MLEGAALQHRQQRVEIVDQDVGGAGELHGKAGVEHVRAGHALMQEARFRPDMLGDMVRKAITSCCHLGLDRVDPGDVESRPCAPDRLGRFLWDDAKLRHRVERMRLDLEPDAEVGLRLPDAVISGPGIARDHGRSLSH